jgi:predicted dienelactone hydrolase
MLYSMTSLFSSSLNRLVTALKVARFKRWERSHLLAIGLMVFPISIGGLVTLAQAAEEVSIRYGLFGRAVLVSSLETFAETGEVDAALAGYLGGLDANQLEQLRQALTASKEIDPITLSQDLQDPMGERMLDYAGEVIQTGSGQNGQLALRAAVIEAAFEPEGLSLINALRAFPTATVRLDLARALGNARVMADLVEQTTALLDTVAAESQQMAAQSSLDYTSLGLDPQQPGPFRVSSQSLALEDEERQRSYPAQVFLPQLSEEFQGTIPVVVISHGLGDSRTSFYDVAQHLASYGFAVALPEHVGSNVDQKAAFQAWLDTEVFKVTEFVDRPLDVSFLLDELEQFNDTRFQGRLNLNNVGVVGHSFGGYTVLALAGATIDFDFLETECNTDEPAAVNLALLLQCRALEFPNNSQAWVQLGETGFRDDRIKFVFAVNPVSRFFGKTGMEKIQIPTVVGASAYDFITPVVPEQAETFALLTTPEKYFLLADQDSHSPNITRTLLQYVYGVEYEEDIEEAQFWLRSNFQALLVGFSQIYLAQQEAYRPFTEAAYVEQIGQDPFLLHLVRSLPDQEF